ncbi:tetratricopeptide repeat protein [Geomicrobium sediminis]|uniref:Response regulator aspartate phosphatase B n=1 Tax=Geomicrobium sediminis TaxID=1347788 RepID=A0ABS2PC62_9BACL|nr:tetratricopeptide repeat protein [Geomicrobium sediminis]MBM7633019.1 response regulator aspartate phosphatase B [Geomicrobium sediminis]
MAEHIQQLKSLIGQWYHSILKHDTEEAFAYKEEVDMLLRNISADDEQLSKYYRLVDFRHSILTEDFMKNPKIGQQIKHDSLKKTDQMLNYLHYFMEGQFEFVNSRFSYALDYYRKAEEYAFSIRNEDKAELFHNLGETLYRMNEYTFALWYLKKAVLLFEEANLEMRKLNSLSFIGAIHTELHFYDEAEEIYQEIFPKVRDPYQLSLLNRAIGLNRLRQRNYPEAKSYFLDALRDHGNRMVHIKTMTNLAHVCFKMNNNNEGVYYLEEAQTLACEHGLEEYIARCMVLRGLYTMDDLALVEMAIQHLETNNLNFEIKEICEHVSEHYQAKGDYKIAYEYLIKANQSETMERRKGVTIS